jgi:hypothetical protein
MLSTGDINQSHQGDVSLQLSDGYGDVTFAVDELDDVSTPSALPATTSSNSTRRSFGYFSTEGARSRDLPDVSMKITLG